MAAASVSASNDKTGILAALFSIALKIVALFTAAPIPSCVIVADLFTVVSFLLTLIYVLARASVIGQAVAWSTATLVASLRVGAGHLAAVH